MLIDTHCHVDQFPSPESIVRQCEKGGLRVVAVTNLPSHFVLAADRLQEHPLLSAALGFHPLCVTEGIRELPAFKRMVPHVNYIGEIGLDFSRQGAASKSLQERVFDEILGNIDERPRFITLHSRGAESSVLQALRIHEIRGAVFHWFTGTRGELTRIIDDGHLVSINPAMLSTRTGEMLIANTPKEAVLVESDGPFSKVGGKVSEPKDIAVVYRALAASWRTGFEGTVEIIAKNFDRIIRSFDPSTRAVPGNPKRCE
jgi:TatD DNase family protein